MLPGQYVWDSTTRDDSRLLVKLSNESALPMSYIFNVSIRKFRNKITMDTQNFAILDFDGVILELG